MNTASYHYRSHAPGLGKHNWENNPVCGNCYRGDCERCENIKQCVCVHWWNIKAMKAEGPSGEIEITSEYAAQAIANGHKSDSVRPFNQRKTQPHLPVTAPKQAAS